jgi:hypothetical protein
MIEIPEKNGELAWKLLGHMEKMTQDRFGALWLENAERNLAFRDKGRSLAELRDARLKPGEHAVVIAAGPSLKRRNPATALLNAGYGGTVIASESAMSYCLRNGLVPDLVVTLDPHASRVVRWFGDPSLDEEKLAADDYFARQDQDEAFADEMKANHEILNMLNTHGSQIKIALSTSTSSAVVDRVLETGMEIYWWNPMLDDPDLPGSVSAQMQAMNGIPCVNAGGNVGTASWMMADAVLGMEHIALTGVDFSYYDGTPYLNTQYYKEAVALVGEENLDALFVRLENPHIGAFFYTDPAYLWYREVFLEMVKDSNAKTYNCTEGGILFGDEIETIPLQAFLGKFGG